MEYVVCGASCRVVFKQYTGLLKSQIAKDICITHIVRLLCVTKAICACNKSLSDK